MEKIVIVEDDAFLREELEYIFKKKGYPTEGISSFAAPLEDIIKQNPGLVLLDLNLPGQSGFELCRSLKAKGIAPILTKPCHPQRLVARVEKLLQLYANMRSLLDGTQFRFDKNTFEVLKGSTSIRLPENEGKILRILMMESPRAVTKEMLFQTLWGTGEYVDENILQVNMTRLRRNLEKAGLEDCIETVRGIGYRIREVEQDEKQMED